MCCILLLSLLPSLQAQDKKATAILDEVKAMSESYKTMKIEFTYTMQNKDENIDESMPGVLYMKGDSYRLNIAGQDVICNGETIWTYIKDANEVQINEVAEDSDVITPSKLFTSYDKNYKARFVKEITENDRTVEIIELVPLESHSFSKVELTVNKANKEVISFVIFDKNGTTFSYLVTRFLHDIPLEPGLFTFNKEDFPGAEIIDMR
jgi:outer membrane lipoprotein carrier protein